MRTHHPITGRATLTVRAADGTFLASGQLESMMVVRERLDTAAQALAEVRHMDAAVLNERAQWLNWRAWLECTADLSRPFTPYHAVSLARRGLTFSPEHRS